MVLLRRLELATYGEAQRPIFYLPIVLIYWSYLHVSVAIFISFYLYYMFYVITSLSVCTPLLHAYTYYITYILLKYIIFIYGK